MRKFGIREAAPDAGAKPQAQASERPEGGLRGHWRLLLLFAVILAAFLLRFVFAYGISAGDSYALSGGTSATTNLRVITEILAGTFDPANVAALNYPYGSVAVHGPFFDYLMAGIASVGTVFGMADADAASAALAWTAPVFGALTCVPVYLIGKKVSGENATVGVLSAVFYATFAIVVMTTPFSNGTVVPLTALLTACFAYALLRTFEALDATEEAGIASFAKDRNVLKHAVASAVLLALIALTWADARVVVLVMAICMFIGFSARRIRGKPIAGMAGALGFVLAVASAAAAAYYVPVGLWDAVASGLVVLGLIAAVLSFAAGALEKKPWVLTIPVFLVVIAVVAVVLKLAAGDVFDAVVHGNSVYTGTLMTALADDMSRTDVSSMAAYYGWLTLWLPFALACWMIYRYRREGGSGVYGFTLLWTLSCFLVGWFSSDYATVAGAGFAVASAVVVYRVCKAVGLRKYFRSLRGNGFKGGVRKAVKFFPLVTVIAVVGLVAVPNAVYAVDAATPTNDEKLDYYGGLGYTIATSDASLMDSTWTYYGGVDDKSGAVVTWYGYSDNAVGKGGFDSVTDSVGGGTATMSSVYLSDGTGAAVASLAIRLMLAQDDLSAFRECIGTAGLDYAVLSGLMTDAGEAREYISENEGEFEGLTADLDSENAVYHAAVSYMSSNASDAEICALYDSVCQITGDRISYIEVDGGMIPMYYGDGSEFSTIAYFGGYTLGDYGNPSEYYSVNSYYGYYTYKDAMYDTFLWRALLGIDASEAGYSASYSLINALALSDGDVKAVPGYGLSGFEVSYWHVMYNPDSDATSSSSGWVDMDAKEAIAKQNDEGGVINYLSSVVVLEYVGYGDSVVSGNVTYTSGTEEGAPAEGVKVSVYQPVDYDSSGKTGYVLRAVAYTDSDGAYTVAVPEDSDYYVVFSAGSDSLRGGTPIATYGKGEVPAAVAVEKTSLKGFLSVGDDGAAYAADGYVVIESEATGERIQTSMSLGEFSFEGIMPGEYSFTAYDLSGESVGTSTLTVPAGESEGVLVDIEYGTLSVTAEDMYGNDVASATFVAVNVSSGVVTTGEIEDGSGTADVPVGTYRVYLEGDYVSVSTSTYSVTDGNTRSVSLTAYEAKTVEGTSGQIVMALGFSTVVGSDGKAYVPEFGTYVVYDPSAASATVSGTVKYGDDAVSGATVSFTGADGTYAFATLEDGSYTAALPAGDYAVYVNNGSDAAYVGSVTVGSEDLTEDIELVAAHKITTRLVYQTYMSSSSTLGVPYVDVSATVDGCTVVLLTNSSGYAYFYAPDDKDTEFAVDCTQFDGSAFTVGEDFTATSEAQEADIVESTWKIYGCQDGAEANDSTSYVNKVTVTSDIEVVLEASNSTLDDYVTEDVTVGTEGAEVVPGQYTAEIKTGGHYFSGTVYVYPSTTKLVMDVLDVTEVTITISDGDDVEVTALENDDEETGSHKTGDGGDDTAVYYLEKGYDYLITATGSDDKVAYLSVSLDEDSADEMAFDMTAKAAVATISGYVGVAADGEIVATYTYVSPADAGTGVEVKIVADVDDGEYEVAVPAGVEVVLTVSVEATGDNMAYSIAGTATLAADKVVEEGVTCNFQSLTDLENSKSEYDGVAAISAAAGSFADGVGAATVSVTNDGKQAKTYMISGGDAFVLDRTYTVTVGAGETSDVEVSGRYNADTVGYGNSGMTVEVSTLAGDSVASLTIPAVAFAASSSGSDVGVDVAAADGASPDSLNGFAYKYAVTIDNPYGHALKVVLTSDVSADGWTAAVCDSSGYLVYGATEAKAFDVAGYGKSTLYLALLSETGSETAVPSAGITVTVTDENGVAVAVATESGLAVSGNEATGTVEPKDAAVAKTDASVSGGDAENEEKEISTTFWAICVVTVVLLLLMVWGGMKRGVFSRRKRSDPS